MNWLVKNIVLVAVACALPLLVASSASAALNPFEKVCNQSDNSSSSFACDNTNPDPVNSTLGKVTNILAFVTGVAAVIVIIIAGFQYITSAGDSSKVAKAKDMIIYAVIGLVVVVMARTIIMFVISRL